MIDFVLKVALSLMILAGAAFTTALVVGSIVNFWRELR